MGISLVKSIDIIHFDFTQKIMTETGDFTQDESNNWWKINILLVWRWWGNHEAPNLTDTIILASINKDKHIISLFSIPRDLYVDYGESKDGKINEIYINNTLKTNSKADGMSALEKKVTQITWEKIDFFVNVDFNGFMKIIDTIGGIIIDVPENFVDNRYPDEKLWYKTIIFKEWKWLFDWENSLKYARSRHSTSDFDRSLRQQQIIKAIKNKLSGSYFIKSPTKIKELYDIFSQYVYTNLSATDILKIAVLMKSSNEYHILSFNLNDSCFYGSDTCDKGGFLYVPNREFYWWMSVLLADGTDKADLNNYDIVKKFTNLIFNFPNLYIENAQIHIYNSLKINHLAGSLSNDIKRYGFNVPEKSSIWNTDTVYEKSMIYYNNLEEDSVTLEVLKRFFSGEFKKVEAPVYSKDLNTKIEIIIGSDFIDNSKNTQSIFSF